MARLAQKEIERLNREHLVYLDLWLTIYSPGDGVARYRLVDAREWSDRYDECPTAIVDGKIPEPDYLSGVNVMTVLGVEQARIMFKAVLLGAEQRTKNC